MIASSSSACDASVCARAGGRINGWRDLRKLGSPDLGYLLARSATPNEGVDGRRDHDSARGIIGAATRIPEATGPKWNNERAAVTANIEAWA